MNKIIFDTATGAYQGYDESVIVLVPEVMDGEELEFELQEGPGKFEQQTIVAWEDMRESFMLAMDGEGIDHATILIVVDTVEDAIGNND